MRTLYIDARMGLSQDMLLASILGHMDNKNDIMHELNVYVPKNIHLTLYSCKSYENSGLQFKLQNDDFKKAELEHAHGFSYEKVLDTIDNSGFPKSAKDKAKGVYEILGKAESSVHKVDLNNLHFHEVGSPRAIYTILSNCYVLDKLNVDKIICSKVNTGYGKTHCAHGIVDVPAPATKEIINSIPTFQNEISGELLTPTGASLLKYFVDEFRDIEDMVYISKSIGIGSKDLGLASGVTTYISID